MKLIYASKHKENDPDYDPTESSVEVLGFFTQTQVQTKIVVPIDESIKGPNYYRAVVQAISELSEDDTVEFTINSPGGRLDGLVSMLSALEMSPCHSVANISGSTSSAASILALHCNEIKVSPYATMMIHNTSFGAMGKVSDVVGHVQHVRDISDNLVRSTYANFLSEDEIKEVLKGQEIWLNADEIIERFTNRFKIESEFLQSIQENEEILVVTDDKVPVMEEDGKIKMKRKVKT